MYRWCVGGVCTWCVGGVCMWWCMGGGVLCVCVVVVVVVGGGGGGGVLTHALTLWSPHCLPTIHNHLPNCSPPPSPITLIPLPSPQTALNHHSPLPHYTNTQVARAICLMNHPIPNTSDSHSVQIILPQGQLGRKSGMGGCVFWVCGCVWMCLWMCIWVWVCILVWVYVCIWVWV